MFENWEVVDAYTLEDAERDGYLIPLGPDADPVSHVTIGVWSQLCQDVPGICWELRYRKVLRFKHGVDDHFIALKWKGTELWAVRNERGKYTVMFPDEY